MGPLEASAYGGNTPPQMVKVNRHHVFLQDGFQLNIFCWVTTSLLRQFLLDCETRKGFYCANSTRLNLSNKIFIYLLAAPQYSEANTCRRTTVKGCLYYDTCTAYMCVAHVRRTCAMNVYTIRRTPVRRTCTAYMYHSVNTLLILAGKFVTSAGSAFVIVIVI